MEIYEWHPVIEWHGNLGEQVDVLCSPWNHHVATLVSPPVGLRQVSMLEQSVADAEVDARRATLNTLNIEMVPVCGRDTHSIDVGIHQAVGRLSGYTHQATKVGE